MKDFNNIEIGVRRAQSEIEQKLAEMRAQRLGRVPVTEAEIVHVTNLRLADRRLSDELSVTLQMNRAFSARNSGSNNG